MFVFTVICTIFSLVYAENSARHLPIYCADIMFADANGRSAIVLTGNYTGILQAYATWKKKKNARNRISNIAKLLTRSLSSVNN